MFILASAFASASISNADIVKVGEIRLCRSSVKGASLGTDRYTGRPVANITLNDNEKRAFADLTSKSVGKRVAITLNGVVIAEPWIDASIREGEFNISGPTRTVLEQVVLAALDVC